MDSESIEKEFDAITTDYVNQSGIIANAVQMLDQQIAATNSQVLMLDISKNNSSSDEEIAEITEQIVALQQQLFQQRQQQQQYISNSNSLDAQYIVLKGQYEEAYVQSLIPEDAEALGEEYMQPRIDEYVREPVDESNGGDIAEKNFLKQYKTRGKKEDFEKTAKYRQTTDHNVINGIMRKDKPVTIENVLEHKGKEDTPFHRESHNDIVESHDSLKKIIDNSYLLASDANANRKVYRTISDNTVPVGEPGDIMTDKAFMSTSINKEYADLVSKNEGDKTIMTLNFPQQSVVNGAYISGLGTEKEFVLPPNTSYKINKKEVRDTPAGKNTLVEADILPSEHVRVLGGGRSLV
jgi:hypothetical protein